MSRCNQRARDRVPTAWDCPKSSLRGTVGVRRHTRGLQVPTFSRRPFHFLDFLPIAFPERLLGFKSSVVRMSV